MTVFCTPSVLQAVTQALLIGFAVGTAFLLPVYGRIGMHVGLRLAECNRRPETPAQRLARIGPPTWEWDHDSRYL